MIIHRLHLNGINYDLAPATTEPHPADDQIRNAISKGTPVVVYISTRQGNQAPLMVNPSAVFAWLVYSWDTEAGVTSGGPDWAADLAAAV